MREILIRTVAVFAAVLLAVSSARAQLPPVGSIDFYGLRTVTPGDLATALNLQIGDSVRATRLELEQRLVRLPGVADASVSLICCEAGRTLVYVGVRENGDSALVFARAPFGAARLPANITSAGEIFARLLFEGIQRGASGEDHAQGHALSNYSPARAYQEQFIAYAADHVDTLRVVLHTASDAEQRALAAQILAYATDKAAIVPDLVEAMRDADENVRNNAMRALAVMAIYEQEHPDAGFKVPFAPFIDLLSSLEWTDRNKSSFALAALTTARDPELLHQLKARAFGSLVDIARWRAFGHAAAAGVILGRIAGLPEKDLIPTFQKNREGVIEAARAAARAPASRR